MKKAYFAGGCFWGVEHYFSLIKGIEDVKSLYINSDIENPTYEQLCAKQSSATEGVEITYDENIISYDRLLFHLFKAIDPTTLNRQGPDVGTQYRSGIYYTSTEEQLIANKFIEDAQKEYDKLIVVEVEPLDNYYYAEEYHQDYLIKNPNGYCHINFNIIDDIDKK